MNGAKDGVKEGGIYRIILKPLTHGMKTQRDIYLSIRSFVRSFVSLFILKTI